MNLVATFDRNLPQPAAGQSVPEWVHLLPLGDVVARDGRRFVVDNPSAVVEAFVANQGDLPIDYEHQSEFNKESRTGPVPAAGWITDMRHDRTGMWGKVKWTSKAFAMIADKE